jgi:ATP-dependent RNA helicase SUPV3L1/SUV3
MSAHQYGREPARVIAVLGPTNTGKTHLAVERMLGHASGMIGLPLRLLAREIYDRIVNARGVNAVALITGEEKIVPPRAHYFVCTVEAMPLNREVEFLAIDEVQLVADPERGHLFTDRLLHARGTFETMLLGAQTMAPLIRRLLPEAEIVTRERFSSLSHTGQKKLSRLPRRSAVVAFSADQVYAIAELIRRQRGGAAVVMGSLSPRTRNAQVALYQSGEVDFLVATDAIGMGLNMDVDHVAFAGLDKFDGKRRRPLHAQEVGQIAGRAGRFRTDGTFGVTAGCEPMDDELIEAVEKHAFEPVRFAQWRNGDLDMDSLDTLQRSLAASPSRTGLKAADEALDERALRTLATDETVCARCADRSALFALWDACQTPDFRKTTPDEHIRLVRQFFDQLSTGPRKVPEDWMAEQLRGLDRTEGEIDALSTRLAGVRTLAYVANRPNWLGDADHWRETTRALENRLSDALHERLMARFIDRRTSALVRGLGRAEDLLAGVARDGSVTVEGHFVGKLNGLAFTPASGTGVLETKALRAAALRAVGPEMARRLGELTRAPDEDFRLLRNGDILWRGEAAGVLVGDRPFAPRARLHGDFGAAEVRERAARRLEAFVAGQVTERLTTLRRLETAIGAGELKGLARGLAWRLVEAGGVLDRRSAEADLVHLSKAERRALRELGVTIGTFCLYAADQLAPESAEVASAFADRAAPDWRPSGAAPWSLSTSHPPVCALGLRGVLAVGSLAVGVGPLERLGELMRRANTPAGSVLSEARRTELGWSQAEADAILRALGHTPSKPVEGQPTVWRKRASRTRAAVAAPSASVASPFSALSALQTAPKPRRRRRAKKAARA